MNTTIALVMSTILTFDLLTFVIRYRYDRKCPCGPQET